ncbi:MAG: hypothetical protein FJZ15_07065, partial [Candidatus Omnitrophica bacterium]|nr:hypothetical protein [Candidatus Omnitrophota bacterium]
MLKDKIDIALLTAAQRGIYFGQLLDKSGCAYNLVQYLDITGDFKVDIFSRSVQILLSCYPALFSVIRLNQDAPGLYLEPFHKWQLFELDFSQSADPQAEFLEWAKVERFKPFNLEKGPLFNWQLVKLGEKKFVFFQSYHHILVDGVSVYQIDKLLFNFYANLLKPSHDMCEPVAASALAVESSYLSSKKFVDDYEFWEKEVRVFDRQSSLSDRNPGKSLLSNRQKYRLPAAMKKRLRHLCTELSISLPRLLISICAMYYARLSGREKILVEIPVACRSNFGELLSLDMRSNISLLRLDFGYQDTISEFCRHVTQRLRLINRHQYYRYEYLK